MEITAVNTVACLSPLPPFPYPLSLSLFFSYPFPFIYFHPLAFSPLERFRRVPSLYIRLQFLQLQVDLLLEFQRDLAESVSKSTTLSESFSAYLNASHYIVSLLQKWGEETVSDKGNIILNWGEGNFLQIKSSILTVLQLNLRL